MHNPGDEFDDLTTLLIEIYNPDDLDEVYTLSSKLIELSEEYTFFNPVSILIAVIDREREKVAKVLNRE